MAMLRKYTVLTHSSKALFSLSTSLHLSTHSPVTIHSPGGWRIFLKEVKTIHDPFVKEAVCFCFISEPDQARQEKREGKKLLPEVLSGIELVGKCVSLPLFPSLSLSHSCSAALCEVDTELKSAFSPSPFSPCLHSLPLFSLSPSGQKVHALCICLK